MSLEQATDYAAEDAEVVVHLHRTLFPRIDADEKLRFVYASIEMPVARILQRMERAGILVDAELLAVFFGTGLPGRNAIDLGRELLARRGGLLARLLGRAGPSTPVAKRWAEACRGPITAVQSWERGLSRLSPEDRAALGDRYLDASFRQHLADDLAEGDRPLVNLLPPTWMHEWSSPVPVTCWAAAGEQAIADIAAVRAGWTLVSSDAQPPFLADWEQILSRAAQAYRTGGTVLPGVAY